MTPAENLGLMILLVAHEAEELSEGQVAAISGLDRVTIRLARESALASAQNAWKRYRQEHPVIRAMKAALTESPPAPFDCPSCGCPNTHLGHCADCQRAAHHETPPDESPDKTTA